MDSLKGFFPHSAIRRGSPPLLQRNIDAQSAKMAIAYSKTRDVNQGDRTTRTRVRISSQTMEGRGQKETTDAHRRQLNICMCLRFCPSFIARMKDILLPVPVSLTNWYTLELPCHIRSQILQKIFFSYHVLFLSIFLFKR